MRIPRSLVPADSQVAVLSLLAVSEEDRKVVRAGSLLTLPAQVRGMSWKGWRESQPLTRGPRISRNDPDLDPSFCEEPFAGVHIHRSVFDQDEWMAAVDGLESGTLEVDGVAYEVDVGEWTGCKLFSQDGGSDAHHVLKEARRPIWGVSATGDGPAMPHVEGLWLKANFPPRPAGERTREELRAGETFANWPIHLLGLWWPGTDDTDAPNSFVVGVAMNDAWIADVVPDNDEGFLRIAIGWDANTTDPLSCSLLVRSELDGASLLVRNWRISDLPGEGATTDDGSEARDLSWNQRTLDVLVPRGPRRTSWGVALMGPDGQLMDELPVARRVESIEFSIGIVGEEGAGVTGVVGDRRAAPTQAEIDAAVAAAKELEVETAARASRRRFSTAGELAGYMKWRFSVQSGDLLILDPYLLDGDEDDVRRVLDFLLGLRRSIRALTAKAPAHGVNMFASASAIDVRGLPNGTATLHDRCWLVGNTGVLTGASLNHFLREESAATTAVDLPFADSSIWREKFEEWWRKGRPLSTPSISQSPSPTS
jgi:hypothetical protein